MLLTLSSVALSQNQPEPRIEGTSSPNQTQQSTDGSLEALQLSSEVEIEPFVRVAEKVMQRYFAAREKSGQKRTGL